MSGLRAEVPGLRKTSGKLLAANNNMALAA